MGSLRMQTLNIEAARTHAVDFGVNYAPLSGGGTSTPLSLNTPDILNSLISITSNPFFDASASATPSGRPQDPESNSQGAAGGGEEDMDKKVFATLEVPQGVSGVINSSNPPVPSIIPPPPQPPSTVQSLRSQFIKDSLKLTIQTKRKCSGKEEFDVKTELETKVRKKEELTPEDEERRKRRRDRNKIAATKCRNKKKEKTGLLVQEAQTLESTNIALKGEISKFEEERQRLTEVLSAHASSCTMKFTTVENEIYPLSLNNLGNNGSNKRDFSYMPTTTGRHYHHLQQPVRRHPPAQKS